MAAQHGETLVGERLRNLSPHNNSSKPFNVAARLNSGASPHKVMSTPANITVFNIVAAKVFVRLYETFPTPTTIDPMLIGIDVMLQEKYQEGSSECKHLVEGADAAIQFLIDEGFVRVASGPQYLEIRGFQNLVLSSKGFSVLQKTPEALDSAIDRRSYFERLKSATASGAKAVATEAIGPLIARLVGAG